MSDIDDGWPAFPVSGNREYIEGHSGMTLRDYFAAKVMHGMAANSEWDDLTWEATADAAYCAADAMLRARRRTA